MRYEFLCDKCKSVREFSRPIKRGPPTHVKCSNCGDEMYLNMDCQFILRGSNWPGKEIKRGNYYIQEEKAREQHEAKEHELEVLKKEEDEILRHRRMGKKASRKHKEENRKMWERYSKRKPKAPPMPKG